MTEKPSELSWSERRAREQAAKERKERFETVAATLNSKAGVEHVKNINDALKKEIADNQKAAEQEAQRSQAADAEIKAEQKNL